MSRVANGHHLRASRSRVATQPGPHASRRGGVAMIEMVLTLPFIFVLLALIMYCGVSMMRWHRVSTVDRYEAWRATAYAPGPGAAPTTADVGDVEPLARAFFPVTVEGQGDAQRVRNPYGLRDLSISIRRGLTSDGNQDPAITYLGNRVLGLGGDNANDLFWLMFGNSDRPLPTVRRVDVGGEFASRFGQTFADIFDHSASRLDGDWRYVSEALDMQGETFYDRGTDAIDVRLYNDDDGDPRPQRIISPAGGLRQLTHRLFINALGQLPATNALAREVSDITLRVPAYVGPKLPAQAKREENGDWDFEWNPPGQ